MVEFGGDVRALFVETARALATSRKPDDLDAFCAALTEVFAVTPAPA